MPEGWEEFAGDEVRWALAETRNAADAMLDLAYALEVRLPGTKEAFRTGVLRRSKAEIIAVDGRTAHPRHVPVDRPLRAAVHHGTNALPDMRARCTSWWRRSRAIDAWLASAAAAAS